MTDSPHPIVVEAARKVFAEADGPLFSSAATGQIDRAARLIAADRGVAVEALLPYEGQGYGRMVPTRWITRLARQAGAVQLGRQYTGYGRQQEQTWATPSVSAAVAEREAARAAEHEQAAERVAVGFVAWDHLVVSDELVVEVTVDGVTVATFRPGGPLGADLASEQAEELARKLRRRLVAAG